MTWDHASNWDEEDLRAVIAFLRTMPAVKNRVPADRAPAADDCAVYTFWTSESHEPGAASVTMEGGCRGWQHVSRA